MDIRKIKKLIEMLEESSFDELEIKEGEESIRLCRHRPVAAPQAYYAPPAALCPPPTAASAASATSEPSSTAPAAVEPATQGFIQRSPMVGTFYRSSSPGGKSFAEVVLLNTLRYRVEQVFLIHAESGLLLQHVTGGSAVPVQQAATAAYLQTHVVGDNYGKGLSAQAVVPNTAGTLYPFTMYGAKVASATFSPRVPSPIWVGPAVAIPRGSACPASAAVVVRYARAAGVKNEYENISWVLYPNDSTPAGRELRLRQEYFFVACSIHDIVYRYLKTHPDFSRFAEKVAIQLNDTHPAVAIAELMRVLVDEHGDLVFRDNDAGWFPDVINRLGDPNVVRRVPRYLYESVQRVTPEVLRDKIEPLLKQLNG